MESFCHWFTELDEVYAPHVSRHGPNRLLPAQVLPVHGRVPEHSGPSPQVGRQGPGSMGSDSKAMGSMLGIMPEIGGMLEQIARRIEAGQLTPDLMTRVGKWLGKLSALLNATPEMLRRGPTESRAPGGSPAGPQARQQRLADLQWLLSDMLTTPQ